MKILISHSSKNSNYGNALVNLLTGIGINGDKIIFTSNDAYGIPIGNNIFDWLKTRITEKPYVLYLLSPEYYKSVACLNEMGAAWVIENKHTMIFTPDFKLDSYEFQNGAIDPREFGFFINNYDKLLAFIESLRSDYNVTSNPLIISQKILEFLSQTQSFTPQKEEPKYIKEITKKTESARVTEKPATNPQGKSRFTVDLNNNKLKDEEVLLVKYIVDNAKFRLFTGWQENLEIETIKIWEDINDINDKLSTNYASALRRFEMKKLTEVYALTGGGNPKEVQIIEALQEELMDISDDIEDKINEVTAKNLNTSSNNDLF